MRVVSGAKMARPPLSPTPECAARFLSQVDGGVMGRDFSRIIAIALMQLLLKDPRLGSPGPGKVLFVLQKQLAFSRDRGSGCANAHTCSVICTNSIARPICWLSFPLEVI